MDALNRLLKTIRGVGKNSPVTQIQLSEIIRGLYRPWPKVYIVFQQGHGFIVGDVIKPANPRWVKAKADTEANAKATAVVYEIIDADHFIYLQEGLVPGDYIIGKTYFLSVTTAGKVFIQTNPETWTVGQYRQMIGTGTADGLLLEIDEGKVWEGPATVTNIINNTYNETTVINNYDTTVINIGQNPATSSVRVFLNGVRLHPSAYSVNGTTVILNDAPNPGEKVRIKYAAWKTGETTPEAPVGAIDGVNKTFTLSHEAEPQSIEVYRTGILQDETQVSLQGDTITFTEAPSPGEWVFVFFKTLPDNGNQFNISPAGAINGVNKDYTIPFDPSSGILKIYLTGIIQLPEIHYTISGSTISFTEAPSDGQWILIDFETQNS